MWTEIPTRYIMNGEEEKGVNRNCFLCFSVLQFNVTLEEVFYMNECLIALISFTLGMFVSLMIGIFSFLTSNDD